MILIISTDFDASTCEVMDWIHFLKGDCLRINDNDMISQPFKIKLNNSEKKVNYNAANFDTENIGIVWYRRSSPPIPNNELKIKKVIIEKSAKERICKTIVSELKEAKNTFYLSLKDKKWLSSPLTSNISKIHTLEVAAKYGLKIPNSIITNSKDDLIKFKAENNVIITKALKYIRPITINGTSFLSYTGIITNQLLKNIPHHFFPSLFQQKIEKEIEIRSFFIDTTFYSMAIFSQQDEQTQVDFRKYNLNNPNRTVPYKLPEAIENKLRELMNALNLNTGSIDLILTTKKEYIFLEVNPVGQFGMVSHPCNYYLEKIIATYLKNEDSKCEK